MVQPCSPALPPEPSVPQVVGLSLLSNAAARGATEAKHNERGAATTDKGEALNLPHPTKVMTVARSQPHARLRTHRNGNHQRICSTTA
ncbi:xanthomonadin biosynthesis protein [Xanthomonas cucurbitae]|nr:xanthomonadin biosynthesis protein [Xanthomonas cucurbitae]